MIQKQKKIDWKLINMRNIKNLLGVELLHNLYNQHISRINAIRFRNTTIYWKDGIAKSYADSTEWDMLSTWITRRFLDNDKVFLKEIKNLINFDRSFLNTILKRVKETNLRKESNMSLGLLLIDIQQTVFGEIYPVNLVQLEYSLTHAINNYLKKYEKNETQRLKMMSLLVATHEMTESVKEEIAFKKIVMQGQKVGADDPIKNKKIFGSIKKHHYIYAYMNCAYGEDPKSLIFYLDKYRSLYGSVALESKTRRKYKALNIKDSHLKTLCFLMQKIGSFRDFNKSILGQSMKYKYAILDEIVRRKLETRTHLNYYLLAEILELLINKRRLETAEIKKRLSKGVVLTRSENLLINSSKVLQTKKFQAEILHGSCASPGIVRGICKIILSKNDITKLEKGDIMIAIGTDFDLMEAIHTAKAVITEEGGLLSHASVVCRELHKPCCINVKDATTILSDGTFIEVNAGLGTVKLL